MVYLALLPNKVVSLRGKGYTQSNTYRQIIVAKLVFNTSQFDPTSNPY